MSELILMDVFCALIILVLLYGLHIQENAEETSARQYRILLYSGMIFVVLNFIADLVDGNADLYLIAYVSNLLLYYSVDFMMVAFVWYMQVLLGEEKENKRFFSVILASISVSIVTTTLMAIRGNLFAIQDGCYVNQSNAALPYILAFLIMIEMLAIVIVKRSRFSGQTFVVIIAYLILPIFPIVMELATGMYSATVACTTVSMLLIYIFIQVEAVEAGKVRASVLEEMSSTDLLTNLKNRRAYFSYREKLNPEENVGVVFCDINGLKYTNDHYGHAAGDELIKKFAKILTDSFRSDECFRVSGDEFIVVMGNIPESKFNQRVANLKKAIDENRKIAAFGFAYGSASCMDRLSAEAEEAMYLDKRLHALSRNTIV